MTRPAQDVIGDLNALQAADFDEWDVAARGKERLEGLGDEIFALADIEAFAPAMFALMERVDGPYVLGSPGPLVHTLEKFQGRYERFLADSLRRKPSFLATWMANRILNSKPTDYEFWMTLLENAASNPNALESTRKDAQRLIAYQKSK